MDRSDSVIIVCCGREGNTEEVIRKLLTEREMMENEVPTPAMPPIEDETDAKEDNPRDYMAYMRSQKRRR